MKGQTKLGACVTLCVSERVKDGGESGYPSIENIPWEDLSCGPDDNPLLFYDGGEIHDTKAYTAGSDWNTIPIGAVLAEYVQQFKVLVPVCCEDPRELASPVYRFKVIKSSADKVKHVLQ